MTTTAAQRQRQSFYDGYQAAMVDIAERIDDPEALRQWVRDNLTTETVERTGAVRPEIITTDLERIAR